MKMKMKSNSIMEDLMDSLISFPRVADSVDRIKEIAKNKQKQKKFNNLLELSKGALMAGVPTYAVSSNLSGYLNKKEASDNFFSLEKEASDFEELKQLFIKKKFGNKRQALLLGGLLGLGGGTYLGNEVGKNKANIPYDFKEKKASDEELMTKEAFIGNNIKAMFQSAPPVQKKNIIRRLLSKAPHMLGALGLTAASAAALVGGANVMSRREAATNQLNKQNKSLNDSDAFAAMKDPQKNYEQANNPKTYARQEKANMRAASTQRRAQTAQNLLSSPRLNNPFSKRNLTAGFHNMKKQPMTQFGNLGKGLMGGVSNLGSSVANNIKSIGALGVLSRFL